MYSPALQVETLLPERSTARDLLKKIPKFLLKAYTLRDGTEPFCCH